MLAIATPFTTRQGLRVLGFQRRVMFPSESHMRKTQELAHDNLARVPPLRCERGEGLRLNEPRFLGLEAVAEGVESEQQRLFLRDCSCDAGQGPLFSTTVQSGKIARMLLRNSSNGLRVSTPTR